MKKQKKGFINFICSLIPGAGQLNMGFEKQGISIMAAFWGIVALTAFLRMEWIATLLPIVWFYSFFHTHNLKNMSEEDFQAEEDKYLFNLDFILKNREELLDRYRAIIAGVIIFVGVCVIVREITAVFWNIIPGFLYDLFYSVSSLVFGGTIGVCIVIAGVVMLRRKKEGEEKTWN